VVALLVAVVLAVAAGCTGSSSGSGGSEPPPPEQVGPRNGGRLVVAIANDTANWSPAAGPWNQSQFEVGRSIYDRLAVYSDMHELLPELAASITPNSDFTEWTITLRDDIVFHDGTPLDGDALKANLEAQQQSPVAGPMFVPVRSIFVTGPRTVRVSMRSPWSTFPHLLTTQVGFVASPLTLASPESGARPIGTGPFAFRSAVPGQSLDASKNSSYWRDGLPRLDDVSFRVMPDGEARVEALSAGRVDMLLADEPSTISSVRSLTESGQVNLLLDPNAEAPKLTIVFNTAKPPFLDVVARNAVAIATDRQAMVAAGYGGLLVPAKGPVSDQSVWFIDQTYAPRDVAQAREDVARYIQTYGVPLAFTIKVPDEPVYLRFAGLWQQQLREAGIVVTVETLPEPVLRLSVALGDFEAAMLPMFGEWHPDLYYPVLHRAQMTPPGAPGLNYARFGTDDIDEALDDARATGELATQVDSYRKVQGDIAGGNAYLFLVRLPQAVGARPDVRDLTVWTTAAGRAGLSLERGTVSLTDAWLDRPPPSGE
jgi:ABC-type transport system substrate-binding protein